MSGDLTERFILVEQMNPPYQLNPIHQLVIEARKAPTLTPLKWEVVDRGEDFQAWVESRKAADWLVLARFTSKEEAMRLLRVLTRGQSSTEPSLKAPDEVV